MCFNVDVHSQDFSYGAYQYFLFYKLLFVAVIFFSIFPLNLQFISLMGKEGCQKQFHEMYCLQHWSYKQLFCFSMFSVLFTVGASWAYLIPLAMIILTKSLELTDWSSYINFLKTDIYDESVKSSKNSELCCWSNYKDFYAKLWYLSVCKIVVVICLAET